MKSDELDEATPRHNGELVSIKQCESIPKLGGFSPSEKLKLDLACKRIEIKYGVGTGETSFVPRRFYRRKITESGEEYYESLEPI